MNVLMPSVPLRCAVSIATHNRLRELEITCQALSRLNPAPDEVWIVADGCTDGTADFIRREYPKFRLIENAISQGHVRSRDAIVRATECEIVLVLDDDSHPMEGDFIARLRQIFAWRPHLAVVSIPQRTDEFPETLEQTEFGSPAFPGTYSNASAALRRSAYLEIGGYDLDFYHAYDEVDYALRALAAGWEIYRPTHLTVRHRFSAVNRDEVRMHQLHARYEQASVWRRCPNPYVWVVSLFRVFRQAGYAAKRGWLWREPQWWAAALGDRKRNRDHRQPVRWPAYRGWMQLVRLPAANEGEWRRLQATMRVRKRDVGELEQAQIAIAATNPCHLYSLARALAEQGALRCYYSGYPRWRLPGNEGMPIATHSARTLAVYGALKFLPPRLRPRSERMFRWQDEAFDRWVSRQLRSADFIHAMPGQCLETFRRAKDNGICTVLNHATGPMTQVLRILKPEYERAGVNMDSLAPAESVQQERAEEMALADFHCVASTVVRDQLVEEGVAAEKIWVIPYGADQDVFYPRAGDGPDDFRIVYAGQYTLRKGLRFLVSALEQAGGKDWRLDCYGPQLDGRAPKLGNARPKCPVEMHPAVTARRLAEIFRQSSVLVLPSLEEGFGLVVVQALNCGIPCIVSDRVGAKDLIVHRENGSIFPAGDSAALAAELAWWRDNRRTLSTLYPWEYTARRLLEVSRLNSRV